MRALIQIVLLFSCVQALGVTNADRFWQIGLDDQRVFYWRTHKSGDKTEVYDACADKGEPVAVATATDATSWALSGQYGNLAARLDKDGMLILTLSGKDYGVGQRIAPITCQDGTPVKVRMIDVAPAERSFAATPVDTTQVEQVNPFGSVAFWQVDRFDTCGFQMDPSKLHIFDTQYWHTSKRDDYNVDVGNACLAGQNFGTVATGGSSLEIKGMTSTDYGGLFIHVEKDGTLKLTLKSLKYENRDGRNYGVVTDCLYGIAHRILPVTCQNNSKPIKVEKMEAREAALSAVASGDFMHLERAVGVTLPTTRNPPPQPPAQAPPSQEVLPTGETFDCRTTPVLLAAPRQLQNAPILGNVPSIWPGALFQGKPFATGRFEPITVDRGPGTVWLTGLNLEGGQALSVKIPKMNADATKKAILDLASQKSKSVESSFDFSTDILYNNDQMAYGLGADGRFLNGLDKYIQIVPAPNKSYVLARFRQSYYTASLEAPASRYSVFADKKSFKDPNNQMGPDNPPLFVGSVAYGRAIFFLVTSPYEGNAVIAALTSANDNKPDATVTSGGKQMTYSQILQGSTFSGYVQGPDEEETKKSIDQVNSAASKYEAVKKILQGIKSTHPSNLGGAVPIKYTAKYLTNRSTASMGFAAGYNRKDCVITPKKYASFTLDIFHIDDNARITLIGPSGNEIQVYEGGSAPKFFDLDNLIPESQKDSDFILRLQLYNVAGPSGLAFALKRWSIVPTQNRTVLNRETGTMDPIPAGTLPDKYKPFAGGSWNVGWIADYKIKLNRNTGAVTVIQR